MSATKTGSGKDPGPLVQCVSCGALVELSDAVARWANLVSESPLPLPKKVWFCKSCIQLGKGAHASKYIMKEKKEVGR
jgi:hypothetical protein